MNELTSRERVRRALAFQGPDRAPRDLWVMPMVRRDCGAELTDVQARFPSDIDRAPMVWGRSQRACILGGAEQQGHLDAVAGAMVGAAEFRVEFAARFIVGRFVDEWGSQWRTLQPGVVGEVAVPALADWSALGAYQLPYEVLEGLDVSLSVAHYDSSDRFVLAHSSVQPFQRVLFLRGFANLMMDLADERAELRDLLRLVHAYHVEELRRLTGVAADGIVFKDDWGSQTGLLISPRQWREWFRPLYAEYCDMIHAAGKAAFFHSDGHITAIFPDLIEIGVDAVNAQLFCMDIEGLARAHRGGITLWGEIDRQHVLAFGGPDEARAAVRRVRRAFDDGRGGLIAQCEWAKDVPTETVAAVFEAWQEPL